MKKVTIKHLQINLGDRTERFVRKKVRGQFPYSTTKTGEFAIAKFCKHLALAQPLALTLLNITFFSIWWIPASLGYSSRIGKATYSLAFFFVNTWKLFDTFSQNFVPHEMKLTSW